MAITGVLNHILEGDTQLIMFLKKYLVFSQATQAVRAIFLRKELKK